MLKIIRTGSSKKAQRETATYTLVVGRVFTVGRKGSDLCFEDDTSISRSHAEIQVEHSLANVSNPALPPSIIITDLGSKFGTYVNKGIESKVKVSMREPLVLGSGDKFRFGLQWNQYIIEYTPLIITTSTIKDVSGLKETIRTLGAHLVSDWREATDLLVMESLVMTIKVVAALVGGKPIVTPEYLHDYLKAVQEASEGGWEVEPMLPNPRNYLPPLNERSLTGQDVLFHPEPGRREIFTGKLFLVADAKALKNYKSIIENGGGKVDLLGKVDPRKLTDVGTVVIGDEADLEDSEDPKVKTATASYLGSGKRIVAEKELGLAALHQDTSTYLNPTARRGPLADVFSQPFPTQSVYSESQGPTQHVFHTMTPTGRSVIPDSQKREREEDSDDDEPIAGTSKRRRSEVNTSTVKGTQDSEDAEVKKQKRLAALFSMSSDEESEEEPSLPPPPPPKPLQSQRNTRSQAQRDETQATFMDVVPATPVNDTVEEPSGSSLRRSPRKRGSAVATVPSQSFVIPESQDSGDDGIIPSGICPASPEFSEEPTLATFSRPSTSAGSSRQKRRPEEELEEELEGASESGNKKRRILQDLNSTTDAAPASAVPEVVSTNGQNGPAAATTGDVTPLGFKFASLVVSNGRNPRSQMAADRNESYDGVVNFKRFHKVSPTFAPRAQIALVPHTTNTMENGQRVMEADPVQEPPAPAARRGRRAAQTNGHAEPPPAPRPRRNAPGRQVTAAAVVEEEEDDFSFH